MTDGRLALGTVELIGGVFTAIDTIGEIIGTFSSLQEATRAFPRAEGTR